ncbi:response regulator [Pseudodesulfovibrio cashew]|uniref:histidine kinase n=1 Tax=Pseudodesulfovibrio cashew TaxID=2678688 RepID=A0A6I6JNM2_9BACT|nr:hybrid sensor histidine kinase/response regulator [Pseudodesulfovibrio cashew]QGY41747.1 response regulator [Pseudodesulfovibrio cashew]
MDDQLIFADEDGGREAEAKGAGGNGTWKVLIVDDQEDVHNVTRLVLDGLAFEGRKVSCLSAYSGQEARELVVANPDLAVMLLDVVMETRRAGLEVAEYTREVARNHLVRIILRTGQPGEAPEREVVTELDINDYRSKTELTSERLITSVITAIRSFRDLKSVNDARRGLHHLAMSVAHQIRNRTVAIAGFANIIKRHEDVPEDVGEHLSTILQEAARLETMVSNVTRYASIEIGEMRPASIRVLLEEAMDHVEDRMADSGGVEWEIFCPDQTVLVDPALFVIAFEAIMDNAVDFSQGRVKVHIKVSPGSLACAIEVSDDGLGIAEEDLPYIFDPFFTRKANGSGMGLAIVRRIVMEHQWDIKVDSTVGKGTLVRVVIPRRELTGMRQ